MAEPTGKTEEKSVPLTAKIGALFGAGGAGKSGKEATSGLKQTLAGVGGKIQGLTSRAASLGSRVSDVSAWRVTIPRYRISIRYKLIAFIMGIIAVTIVSMSWFILNQQKEQLYQQTVQTGKVSLNSLFTNAKVPLIEDDILRMNTSIKEIASVEGLLYGIILDRGKVIKAHSETQFIGKNFEPFPNASESTTEQNVTYYSYTDPQGTQVLNLSRPVSFGSNILGEVHVGISLDFINAQIRRAQNVILLLSLFVVLFGIGTGVLMGFNFTRPISQLVVATNEIGKGNFEYKIKKIRNDELGELATAVNTMSEELFKKEMMQGAFGKYVGSEILDLIMSDPDSAMLKGTRSSATVVFTDVRGFTKYSESREPEAVVEALNEYFAIATQAIQEKGGYVDKFIGDAVLGVFGVPIATENHAEMAVRASMDMQREFMRAAEEKNNELLARVGIGINTGDVVSGNIGSADKMEYTVIGDTVNVASRLNGLAKSGEVIISDSTFGVIKELLEVAKLELQSIKGKTEKIQSYRVVSVKNGSSN